VYGGSLSGALFDDGWQMSLAPPLAVELAPRSQRLALRSVSPQPGWGEVRAAVEVASAGEVGVELFDVQGRLVARSTYTAGAPGGHVIPVPGTRTLPAAVYVLRLTQAHERVQGRVVLAR
jgi:hypothetical protein